MPKKKTYRVSGASPVVVDGNRHVPDEVFETASDVSFLLGIGAVKESQATPDAKKKDEPSADRR